MILKKTINTIISISIVFSLFACSSKKEIVDNNVVYTSDDIIVSSRSISADSMHGTVSVKRSDGQKIGAYEGMSFLDGDSVDVSVSSDLTLMMDMDKILFADSGTKFSLSAEGTEDSTKTQIYLEKGSILCQIKEKLNDDESFEIVTPYSAMSVRGTVFRFSILETDDNHTYELIEVYDGTVWSHLIDSKADLQEVTIEKGKCALIKDGEITDDSIYVLNDQLDLDFYDDPNNSFELLKETGIGSPILEIPLAKVPEKSLKKLIDIIDDGTDLAVEKEQVNKVLEEKKQDGDSKTQDVAVKTNKTEKNINNTNNNTNNNNDNNNQNNNSNDESNNNNNDDTGSDDSDIPVYDYQISDLSNAYFIDGALSSSYDGDDTTGTFTISAMVMNVDLKGLNGNEDVSSALIYYKYVLCADKDYVELSFGDDKSIENNENIKTIMNISETQPLIGAMNDYLNSHIDFELVSIVGDSIYALKDSSETIYGLAVREEVICNRKEINSNNYISKNTEYYLDQCNESNLITYMLSPKTGNFLPINSSNLLFSNANDCNRINSIINKYDTSKYITDSPSANIITSSNVYSFDNNSSTASCSVNVQNVSTISLNGTSSYDDIKINYTYGPNDYMPVFKNYVLNSGKIIFSAFDETVDTDNKFYNTLNDGASPNPQYAIYQLFNVIKYTQNDYEYQKSDNNVMLILHCSEYYDNDGQRELIHSNVDAEYNNIFSEGQPGSHYWVRIYVVDRYIPIGEGRLNCMSEIDTDALHTQATNIYNSD